MHLSFFALSGEDSNERFRAAPGRVPGFPRQPRPSSSQMGSSIAAAVINLVIKSIRGWDQFLTRRAKTHAPQTIAHSGTSA